MADLTPEQIAAQEAEAAKVKETEELVSKTKTEQLRELSQKYNIDFFKPEEVDKKIQELNKYQESQKTEHEKVQEQLNALKAEKDSWVKEKLEFTSKLKASELGIPADNLEDALKLADNNPDNLPEVLKKYPHFKSKEGITIGLGDPQNQNPPPSAKTEVEAYMAANPKIYKK